MSECKSTADSSAPKPRPVIIPPRGLSTWEWLQMLPGRLDCLIAFDLSDDTAIIGVLLQALPDSIKVQLATGEIVTYFFAPPDATLGEPDDPDPLDKPSPTTSSCIRPVTAEDKIAYLLYILEEVDRRATLKPRVHVEVLAALRRVDRAIRIKEIESWRPSKADVASATKDREIKNKMKISLDRELGLIKPPHRPAHKCPSEEVKARIKVVARIMIEDPEWYESLTWEKLASQVKLQVGKEVDPANLQRECEKYLRSEYVNQLKDFL